MEIPVPPEVAADDDLDDDGWRKAVLVLVLYLGWLVSLAL